MSFNNHNITNRSNKFIGSTYWKPFKDNSENISSWYDYRRDLSLVKFISKSFEQIINETSKDQISAIFKLKGQIEEDNNRIINALFDVNSSVSALNRNVEIQNIQQNFSNELLQKIIATLSVTEEEKVRVKAIELGLRYFARAKEDSRFFHDALVEFEKAELIFHQDYRVLFHIGLIYLFSIDHLDVKKALQIFSESAKYAEFELVELEQKNNQIDDFELIIEDKGTNELALIAVLKIEFGFSLDEARKLLVSRKCKVNFSVSLLESKLKNFEEIGAKVCFYQSTIPNSEIKDLKRDISQIFEKIAFAHYIIGNFEKAAENQKIALEHHTSLFNFIFLAKYLSRIKKIEDCINALKLGLKNYPEIIDGAILDFDLILSPEVIEFINHEHQLLNKRLAEYKIRYENLGSISENIKKVIDIEQQNYRDYSDKLNAIIELETEILNKEVEKQNNDLQKELLIDELNEVVNYLSSNFFLHVSSEVLEELILRLEEAKLNSVYEIKSTLKKVRSRLNKFKKLYIGLTISQGVVFYIDQKLQFYLVADLNQDRQLIWSKKSNCQKIYTQPDLGCGLENSRCIRENSRTLFPFLKVINKQVNAAMYCHEMTLNEEGYWFLPSLEELRFLVTSVQVSKIYGSLIWTSTQSELDRNSVYVFNVESQSFQVENDVERKLNVIPIKKIESLIGCRNNSNSVRPKVN